MTILFSSARWRRSVAAFVLTLFTVPFLAAAQNPPLAEVAKKEQERRKTLKTPPKVITAKDLPKTSAPPPAPAPASGAPAGPGGAEPAAAAPEQKPGEPERDETWWRTRMGQLREALRRDEAFLEALQSRVNALSTDFVNRDDPFQRAKIAEDRQKALSEMERVKTEIEQLKKQIEDLEEEARKAGVPPGWLR